MRLDAEFREQGMIFVLGVLAGTLDTRSDEKATEDLCDFQGLGYGTLTCGE